MQLQKSLLILSAARNLGGKKGVSMETAKLKKKKDRNSQVIFYLGKIIGSYNKKAELADKIVKIKNQGIFEFHTR